MGTISFFEKRSRLFWGIAGLICVILIGILDYQTGYEINISLFYLIPVSFVSWYGGGRMGLIISAASATALTVANIANGLVYSNPAIHVWNALFELGFFFVVAWLVSALRKTYKANQEIAHVDYVTGAISIRHFYDLAKTEIGIATRYKRPFSFAYIDADNFKVINDRLGHSTGDRVLRTVTETIQRQIRSADTLGRLGGDEFALLLPETSEENAKKVMQRIYKNLVDEMLKNGWAVTFSVGVVTYNQPPKSVDEMVKLADSVMYSVKTSGKDGVAFNVYAG